MIQPARLLACLLLALPAYAQEGPPAPAGGPRLTLEARELSFGEVVQGQSVRLPIKLQNRGDAPLVISHAETTCGCSVARFPDAPVPPGGSAELVIEFDSRDRTGQQGFEVYVFSNDPTQADRGAYCTHLVIRGEVRNDFRLTPRGAYFGEVVRGGDAPQRTVKIVGTGPAREGFRPELVEDGLPGWVAVSLKPAERGAEVAVRLLPHAPPGEHLLQVVLRTGVESQPELRVPVAAVVVEPLEAPGAIVLGSLRRGQPWPETRVPLLRRDADGLPVRAVEFDPALLRVRHAALTPRRTDLLVAPAPDLPPGPLATTITVLLDVPSRPRLVLPVFAAILPRVEVEPLELCPDDGQARLVVRGAAVRQAALEPADAAWRVELGPPGPAGRTVTIVAAAPGAPPPAAVILSTDAPGEEQVRVPVRR